MEQLVVDKAAADEAQVRVAEDEAEATIQQAEASKLQAKAADAVADAQKILDQTTEEIKSLKKEHLVEIKAFTNPPKPVYWTLAGVCVMFGERVPLKPIPGSLTNEKKEDYFEYAKEKLLNDPPGFLDRLLKFANSDQKNNIPPEVITKLDKKIKTEPDFAKDRVANANLATRYLWSWVNAMYTYNETYVSTKPLREELAGTQKILDEKNAILKKKKDELDKINQTIARLEAEYKEGIDKKDRLTNQKKDCEIKLARAHKLTSGLSDEKERWANEIKLLKARELLIAGDSVVSAGMVAYAGPLTSKYRVELETLWVKKLDE